MIPLNFVPKELSPAEFKKIATYIEKNVGIKMPPEKRLMMQSRLSARLKALKMNSYQEYIDYVFSGGSNSDEIIMMIDAMTTNLTEFFREPQHFEYMKQEVLPRYAREGRNSIKLWSAGCSTGHLFVQYLKLSHGLLGNFFNASIIFRPSPSVINS